MRRGLIWSGVVTAMLCGTAGALTPSQVDRSPAGRAATGLPAERRIDINRASVEELLTIPGLSRVWAARIVRFRPYRTKEDLQDKGVVSSVVYDKIKDFVIAHHDKPSGRDGSSLR